MVPAKCILLVRCTDDSQFAGAAVTGGVLLALLASVSWGASDFLGGFTSRTSPLPVVLAGSQLAGLLLFAPILALHGVPMPDDTRLLYGLAAGVFAVAELGLIYAALRRGPVVVMAPIAALGACLPVVVGIAGGDQVDLVIAIGLVSALAGSVGASWAPSDSRPAREALGTAALAAGAAIGAGTILLLIDASSKADAWWTIAAVRGGAIAVALPLLGAYALTRPGRAFLAGDLRRLTLAAAATIAAVGICDVAADTAYANATRSGALSVVAVLASLYPVTTIALGSLVLRERPLPIQLAGAALACLGIALLSAGA
jgi:drug/metabolite transporter (DMT)-like permease